MEEKKQKKTKESELGYPIHYVKFHAPVPQGLDAEPVHEFRIQDSKSKYKIESMRFTPEGILYTGRGKAGHLETGLIPLANVVYCRLTL